MLSKITNAGRTFASLISGRFGNNALATLNDINQVVDDINFINNFTDARILFTQTGTLNPTFRIISSGVSSSRCSKECDSGGGDVCCDEVGSKHLKNTDWTFSMLRTATGVFTLRLTALNEDSYPEGLLGATFIIGATSTLGNRVTVTFNPLVTASNILEYTVRTYNDAGTLSDDRLSNTLFNISIYAKPPRSRQVLPMVRF
jgi:hypothetical protein